MSGRIPRNEEKMQRQGIENWQGSSSRKGIEGATLPYNKIQTRSLKEAST